MSEFTPAPVKPTVAITALEALDIRAGTIERANPREIEGRQALFVLNLEPRKMAGEVSEGMLFDIGYADGVTPALAVPEKPVPNGTRAG